MSFVQLCQDINIPFRTSGHKHTRKGWVQIHCPFCGGGKSGFDLGYNLEWGNLNCWRCGKHSLWDFLRVVSDNTQGRLIKEYDLRPHFLKHPEECPKIENPVSLPETKPLSPHAKRFLINRGFQPDHISQFWKVRSTIDYTPEQHRILIPVTKDNVNVSYTLRAIGDTSPRYLSASSQREKVPIKHCLYGEDLVTSPFVFVCEGPFDVWRIGPPAVATFGTQVTSEQILGMSKYPTVILCFDNDHAGGVITERLGQELSLMGVKVFDGRGLFDTKDPGDLTEEQASKLKRELFQTASEGDLE
jgi:5S rRNA maturation endonuclease (ribonuclease M5)